jgi:hypothetical protein
MLKLAPILVTAVILVAFPTNEAIAKTYGAIAVVWGQGRDYHGVGTGSNAGAARRAALAACRNSRCKIATKCGPGQCVFVVLGERQVWWNDRLFSAREQTFVLATCRKNDSHCKVIYSKCLPE